MKKVFFALFALTLLVSFNSCTKCWVCKDKTSTTYEHVKYCDKDYDKGDVDAIIEDMEDNGYSCHASTMAL
ncbi:MAG: hypothetical protein U0T74_09360 [Chitinophagales bacterium]